MVIQNYYLCRCFASNLNYSTKLMNLVFDELLLNFLHYCSLSNLLSTTPKMAEKKRATLPTDSEPNTSSG